MSETNEELDAILSEADEEFDDDEVEIDLTDAGDDKDFEPFKGKRLIVITEAEVKTFSTGTTGISCVATVVDEQNRNRKLWFNLMLGGKGVYLTKQAFKAVGAEVDWENPRPKIKPRQLVNVPVLATCKIVSQAGYKDKTEVSGLDPAPEGTDVELPE